MDDLIKKKPYGNIAWFFDHNATAAVVAFIFIAIALHICGSKYLVPIRDEVASIFYNGTPEYAFNIDEDIKQKVKLASDLISIAGNHPSLENHGLVKYLWYYISLLKKDDFATLQDKFLANGLLNGYAIRLRSYIGMIEGVTDAEKEQLEKNRLDMNALNTGMYEKVDIFNANVDNFNNMVTTFPTNTVRFFSGMKKLDKFDYPEY